MFLPVQSLLLSYFYSLGQLHTMSKRQITCTPRQRLLGKIVFINENFSKGGGGGGGGGLGGWGLGGGGGYD